MLETNAVISRDERVYRWRQMHLAQEINAFGAGDECVENVHSLYLVCLIGTVYISRAFSAGLNDLQVDQVKKGNDCQTSKHILLVGNKLVAACITCVITHVIQAAMSLLPTNCMLLISSYYQ